MSTVNKLNRRGQGMIEYVILVALIAMASVGATRVLGRSIRDRFRDVEKSLTSRVNVPLGDTNGDLTNH